MKKEKRTTICDAANKLNVFLDAVFGTMSKSRYPAGEELNGIIISMDEELRYYPSEYGLGLVKKSSRIIGVILPYISSPLYSAILKGIEDMAQETGYHLLVCSTDNGTGRQKTCSGLMAKKLFAGIISIFPEDSPDESTDIVRYGRRILSIREEKKHDVNGIDSFRIDREEEAYMAASYLIRMGHKKIAFLCGTVMGLSAEGKLKGYKRAMIQAGLEVKEEFIHIATGETASDSVDSGCCCRIGAALTERLLAQSPEVTAILCMDDLLALGCISELQRRGFSVPDRYSVMGFGDIFFSETMVPGLTTVKFREYDLGRLAMRTLTDLIERNKKPEKCDLNGYCAIVERESVLNLQKGR